MKRASQNLSHHRLLTMNMGQLVPVGCIEVLPGDKFVHATRAMIRVQTLLAPLMHIIQARIHHWYVPNRIIWEEWETFITGKTEPTFPTITIPTANHTDLTDHLGIPPVNNIIASALPLRAYALIWNEFYRDQDLNTPLVIDLTSGADSTTSLALQHVTEEKDYFTTAREDPQMGDTVLIPFAAGSEAPVLGIGTAANDAWTSEAGPTSVRQSDSSTLVNYSNHGKASNSNSTNAIYVESGGPGGAEFPNVRVDLSQAVGAGIDINDFRLAMSRQKFAEHRNRFGSRYVDYLRFLGIRPSDARLQRPEYLGGGRQVLSFSEVLATAEGTTTDVGDMAGHGIAGLRTRRYRRFFEEGGHVISLMSVRPKAVYSQQFHRMWLRRTKDDFWQKENEAEGPQAVFTQELYGAAASAATVFGYTGRHDDYRRLPSYVSGAFRTGETFDYWHLGRNFSAEPTLNAAFLKSEPRTDIYGSANDPQLYVMADHNIQARRLVSFKARH